MENEKELKYEIDGCEVSIKFAPIAKNDCKADLLWFLTQCFEERVVEKIGSTK